MIDKKKLRDEGIDYESGVKRFAGKEKIYEKYLFKYLQDDHFEKAEKSYNEQDFTQVLEELHALKGIAGTLGIQELFQLCSDIVTSIRNNNNDIDETFEYVKTENLRVKQIIESMV